MKGWVAIHPDAPRPDGSDPAPVYKVGTYQVNDRDGLNLRQRATTYNSTILAAIPYGTKLAVTQISSTNTNWGKTTYGGKSGWVCLDYTKYIGPLKPSNVKLTVSNSNAVEGTKLTFTATADNSPTSFKITISGQGTSYSMTNGKYSISTLKPGTYTAYATATNQTGSANSPSITFTVNPKVPSNVKLTISSSNVVEGTTLTFTATADNYPTSFKITISGQGTSYTMTNGKYSISTLKPGTYTAYATATNQTGSANSPSITFTVKPKVPSSVRLTISSSNAVEGTALTFTATADNSPTSYKLTISGQSASYAMTNGKCTISTLRPGTYTAYATASNQTGSANSPSITFTVNPKVPSNVKLTISSSNAVEGTTLTVTATADNSPTSFKLTISGQGTSYTMTNGKYSISTLKPGTYTAYATASNQTGSANSPSITFEVLPKPPTNVKLTISSSEAVAGTNLIFTATADNSPTEFRLVINGQRNFNHLMPDGKFSTSLLSPGTYTAYVFASNKGGNTSSPSISFTVLPRPIPLTVAVFRAGWSDTYELGQTIDLAARGEGGTAPYKYQFYVLRSNGNRVNFRSTPVSSNIYPWTPVSPDVYTLGVDIYDATGQKVTQEKMITVVGTAPSDPLSVAVFRAGWSDTYDLGQTIDLAARGEGGLAPYKYQFYVLRSNGARVNFRSAPVSSNIYPWTPVTPDTYTLGVDIYDALGQKVNQEKTITVKAPSQLSVAVFRAGWSDTYTLGQTIGLAARGEGGTEPYKYQFFVLRSNGTRVNFRSTPVSSNIYPWTPVTPDTYTLGVDIYDATGQKVTGVKMITVLPEQ